MVQIIEVSPRDGLQNENLSIPTSIKKKLVVDLIESGLNEIEVSSFVSPKKIPQLADASDLFGEIHQIKFKKNILFSALVPNSKGLKNALESKVERIAIFTAASEAFTQHNINMSISESIHIFKEVIQVFKNSVPNGWVRGYVSTAFECPYSGLIQPKQTLKVIGQLFDIGINEVSIGDTIGVAVPKEVRALTSLLKKEFSLKNIAYHFHDTRGTAIANVYEALEQGISRFDASAGGLGGCPYAPGAGGNLSTEDLVYFLERTGIKTGIDLKKLAKATLPIFKYLGKSVTAKNQQAILSTVK